MGYRGSIALIAEANSIIGPSCDPHGGEVRVEFRCGGGADHDRVIVLAHPLLALKIADPVPNSSPSTA
jgi:hypothetical protein